MEVAEVEKAIGFHLAGRDDGPVVLTRCASPRFLPRLILRAASGPGEWGAGLCERKRYGPRGIVMATDRRWRDLAMSALEGLGGVITLSDCRRQPRRMGGCLQGR